MFLKSVKYNIIATFIQRYLLEDNYVTGKIFQNLLDAYMKEIRVYEVILER